MVGGAQARQPQATGAYVAGRDRVEAEFRTANPRNNLRTEGTFLAAQRLADDGGEATGFRLGVNQFSADSTSTWFRCEARI